MPRPNGGLAWDVPISGASFDRSAFDKLVDDFAEKAAARLLADDASITTGGITRDMPVPHPAHSVITDGSTYLSQGSSGGFRRVVEEDSPISLGPQIMPTEHHRMSSDLMHDTLSRLSRIEAPDQTILIPQWNEHRLPDGSLYWSRPISYDLPMLLLVTDIDLRETGALNRVENFLARSTATSGEELEGAAELGQERDIWLSFFGPVMSGTKAKGPAALERGNNDHVIGKAGLPLTPTDPSAFKIIMVDHAKRTTLPHIDHASKDSAEDDVAFGMQMENSYWSFVESHPAHRSTSERDRDEAMEFLAWCLADQLMLGDVDSNGQQYPFTLAQSRELMDLIRSVDGMSFFNRKSLPTCHLTPHEDGPTPGRSTMIKTRIVAKVSLRNVAWRQALYAASREEAKSPLIENSPVGEEPIIVNAPVKAVTASNRSTVPPVNNGVVRGGLRMMVSRMLGFA
ncbi:hypothetical protein DL93DRAFT_2085457 [Clavulina sp. PMI_390]|nr:hypothetical protein DL93DRAFT_2085457 [Clavulina sp. PMI_390]